MLGCFRERNAQSSVNLHFPLLISAVIPGVIVLLLAADKPLEDSGLYWILSEGRQTDFVTVVSSLCFHQ